MGQAFSAGVRAYNVAQPFRSQAFNRVGRPVFLFLLFVIAASCLAPETQAQTGNILEPPRFRAMDENGIDLTSGRVFFEQKDLSIGDAESGGGLELIRYVGDDYLEQGPAHNFQIFLRMDVEYHYIVLGSTSRTVAVTYNAQGPVANADGGEEYIYGGSYTLANGVKYIFGSAGSDNIAVGTEIEYPDGRHVRINWKIAQGQYGVINRRIQSVTSSDGYQLKFEYISDQLPIPGQVNDFSWEKVSQVTAINNAVEFCDPLADHCSLGGSWPSVTYSRSNASGIETFQATSRGIPTLLKWDAAGFHVSNPVVPNSDINYVGDINYYSSAVTKGGATWYYTRVQGTPQCAAVGPDLPTRETITRTDPLNRQTTVVTDPDCGYGGPTSVTDPSGTITYSYSGFWPDKITHSNGTVQHFLYDSPTRGNVVWSKLVSRTPGTPADIVMSATYPPNCSNLKTCHKPLTVTDARGNITTYTYDQTHGGVLSATSPADANGLQPQTRYSYQPLYPWAKNSSGALVQATTPIYRLTGTSSCRTGAGQPTGCSDPADESRTTITYEIGSSTAGSNVLPVTEARGTGAGIISTTTTRYDPIGNVIETQGPLGSADVTRTYYDAGRRLIGVVGPDPDGTAGARKPGAVRNIYNSASGLLERVERGTVNNTTDNPSGLTVLETVSTSYDAHSRKVRDAFGPIGAPVVVTDYSYDNVGRASCVAERMNMASLPSDACTLGIVGANGPDRIIKTLYTATDQIERVQTAFGVTTANGFPQTLQTDEVTNHYNAYGKRDWVKDAKGNQTSYSYDGFDRLERTTYPDGTYEHLTLDPAGNVTGLRGRRGWTTGYTYDNLNRLVTKVVPDPSGLPSWSTRDVYLGYDLFGNTTYARFDGTGGEGITNSFNAISQLTSTTTNMGGVSRTLSYQYDLAGKRTRLIYPDHTVSSPRYVNYNRDALGQLDTAVLNGTAPLLDPRYDTLGRLSYLYRYNTATGSWGAQSTIGYDVISRLASLGHDVSGTTYDVQATFVYNPASQIATLARNNDLYAWTGHVNVNRIYTSNGLNQYSAVGGASFSYDLAGNLISDGVTSFAYDVENRMIMRNGGAVTLRYDPLGRLYEVASTTTGTRRFLYDGDALVAEHDGSGALVRRFVHGPAEGADDPLVWFEGGTVADSARRYLYADERGSIVAVTDSLGNVNNVNTYDEYGIPGGTNAGRFQYTGQAWLPELGMYHYKARMYSPTLGRFMQTDPIGYEDQFNLYAYVGNDPVNGVDPKGERTIFIGGGCDGYCPGQAIVLDYAKSLGASYYSHLNAPIQVLEEIRQANANGEKVVLIGHSLGGNLAARVAAFATQFEYTIDLLVTVDPVGELGEKTLKNLEEFSGESIDVRGDPSPANPSRGDKVASWGRWIYGETQNFADEQVNTTRHHQEFGRMLEDANVPERACEADPNGEFCN